MKYLKSVSRWTLLILLMFVGLVLGPGKLMANEVLHIEGTWTITSFEVIGDELIQYADYEGFLVGTSVAHLVTQFQDRNFASFSASGTEVFTVAGGGLSGTITLDEGINAPRHGYGKVINGTGDFAGAEGMVQFQAFPPDFLTGTYKGIIVLD